MRMVYRLMGCTLPKSIRTKLAKGGADFSDYFPPLPNNKPGPYMLRGMFGNIEIKEPATDEELQEPTQPKKEEKIKKVKLMAELQQVKMEMETMQGVNTNLTIENIALKHKAVEYLQQIKDMKVAIKNLTAGNKDEIEDIKYMFLTKKGHLVEIINGLKTKVNNL